MEKIDVLVIGRTCLDITRVVEKMPAENGKQIMYGKYREGGGQGGTASCCISRLGGRVAYVGKIGDDAAGRFCLQRLKDFGVQTKFVQRVPGGHTPTAYIFVTRSNGNRTILYEDNALPKISMDDIHPVLACDPSVLLLDPEVTYLADSLKRLPENRPKIVYDAERWRSGIKAMMEIADFFIPSADFLYAKELNMDGLELETRIIDLNHRVRGRLIVTAGASGSYYVDDENRLCRIRPLGVDVKDTTGAGDNFHAAFALAVSRGIELEQAIKLATAVGSLSCRAYGGRAGIPDMTEAMDAACRLKLKILTDTLNQRAKKWK